MGIPWHTGAYPWRRPWQSRYLGMFGTAFSIGFWNYLQPFCAKQVNKNLSTHDVHSRYMDAMALITRYGKPDFFCDNDIQSILG
jgi:hypothetical protein